MSEITRDNTAQTSDTSGASSRSNLVLPVILIMGIGLLAGCGLLWLSAEVLDRKAEASAKHLVQSLLQEEIRRLNTLALDYTWWDTPFERVFSEPDLQWADDNIGSYIADVYGVDASFAIDSQNDTVIGFIDGEPTTMSAQDHVGAELQSMIARARANATVQPQPVTAYLKIGPNIQFVTISPFVSEDETAAKASDGPEPVLVIVKALDADFLGELSRVIGLEGMEVTTQTPPRTFNRILIRDWGAQAIGYIAWRWSRPGEALLWRLAPALGSALCAMIYLLYIFFRSTDIVLERQARLVSSLRRERELRDLKTRFISMVSHELRTPLATIRSAADMLDRYEDRMTKDDRRKEVGAIRTAVDGLTRLLENVMVIGRSDTKARADNSRLLHLIDFCQQVWDDIARGLQTDQRLIIKCQSNRVMIEADEAYLHALLSNLFQNAIKYAPESPDVVVEIVLDQDTYTVRVSDTGKGIPAEEQEIVFEPFQRGRSVGAVSGTGLGLAVARAAAQSLGGTLTVKSEPGAGAMFEAVLPKPTKIAA